MCSTDVVSYVKQESKTVHINVKLINTIMNYHIIIHRTSHRTFSLLQNHYPLVLSRESII